MDQAHLEEISAFIRERLDGATSALLIFVNEEGGYYKVEISAVNFPAKTACPIILILCQDASPDNTPTAGNA